jgi:hydrogenase expression/formation protein HypD
MDANPSRTVIEPGNLKTLFSDRSLAGPVVDRINSLASQIGRPIRIMEVCGTHTVALRRSGIHSLLPKNVILVSGPGCPVCVTPTGYIDNALSLLDRDFIVATFGDMLKVPGSEGLSLSRYMGSGRVRIVYSPAELLSMENERIVFLGIGFETTIPVIAKVFLEVFQRGNNELLLYTAFKTVPPALKALLAGEDHRIDAFLLPGHVSVILGVEPYRLLESPGGLPGVIAGFEPLDMLSGISAILEQVNAGENRVENLYPRVVREQGNPKARAVIAQFLEPRDELWRGLGTIPDSGLGIRPEYARLDAQVQLELPQVENYEPPGCRCAEVIQGITVPPDCSLFSNPCTPESPVGPCMVSSEGTCAAYFRYGQIDGI